MPQPSSHRAVSIALVLLAIAARGAAIVLLQSPSIPRSTYEHGEIAANLLAGKGFSTEFLGAFGPTSQQAPIYPLLVAAAFALGGVETEQSLWILQLAQAALGGLLVWGVMRLARQLVPDRPLVAPIAGVIAALHPTLVYAATHVQVAGLAAALLIWTLSVAESAARSGRLDAAVFAGGLLGALVLTDPILALSALAIVLLFVQRSSWRVAIKPLFTIGLTTLLVASPWLARNYLVHGEFVFVKSTFGYAFWQGNCRQSHGTDKVVRASVERILADAPADLDAQNRALWSARHEAGYIDDIALTRSEKAMLGGYSEPARGRLLMARAVRELAETPGRYVWLCWRRLRYFLLFDETNPKTRHLLYRLPHLSLSLLAAGGLLVAGRRRIAALAPGALLVLALTLFHTLTIVSARFHVPIEPLLAIWAALAIESLGRGYPRLPTVSYASGSKSGFCESSRADGSALAVCLRASRRAPKSVPAITPTTPMAMLAPQTQP